ncbi:erythrocyte membrane protein 1 (PfEMP1), putative [Plasmodium sp.]|nr:erythrocyte membrane protein 1 (PfEMP1), putative [Plasmodium sp.]
MGSQLSKSSKPSVVPNESHKSPRNVLEGFAESIKNEAEKDSKENQHHLKGDLTQAVFRDAHFRKGSKQKYDNPYPCFLDYRWNTNLGKEWVYERHPCYSREQNRFDEDQESECSNIYIRGDGNDSKATACAPPRRRHMCDKNLEALNERNTQNVHDLLGNVLVTAKYEGESIVNNHPHEGTSEVCIALARSFADIGDIVRGKDMFKPNDQDEVWNGLRSVFKKINDNLKEKGINDYDDKYGNYFKLREDWWTANRNKVWEAITCVAPYNPAYFMQSDRNTQQFSNRKCGHEQGNVPTNLDYVPQYLRWYDEWAEEFCRKKKLQLENVKNACRNDSKGLYCSHNGYDCIKTIRKKDICIRDSKCTECSTKCKGYELSLGRQGNQFEKQKEKYKKEIQTYVTKSFISNSSINNKYYEDFYKKLEENKYANHDDFLNLLNEGKYCKGGLEGGKDIDFTNTGEKGIFYRSDYCQVCPHCGVNCKSGTCEANPNNDGNCSNTQSYTPPKDKPTTEITVLYSADQEGDISNKLNEFCTNPTNYKSKNKQIWQCYYVNSENNACKMLKRNGNNMSQEKITKFHNFFEMWVTYLLTETITWNDKLKSCINNTKTTDCIDKCNKNCVCFDKWIKQKEEEWNSIKKLFTKEHNMPQVYYHNINNYFEFFFFHVMKKLNKEAKWKELMENLEKKIESSKQKTGSKDLQLSIELLLEYLNEYARICKDNNTNEACDPSVNRKTNPCRDKGDGDIKPTKNVKQIAQYYKRLAYAQLNERGGRRNLKGDASKGTYKHEGNASDFKDKLCDINKKHSNRNDYYSQGPCTGKDGGNKRFEIGTKWQGPEQVNKTYQDVYLPPRREHMCTSNLEYLQADDSQLNGSLGVHKVNDSFLGDVLLAAKFEAERTKKEYKHLSDKQGICRAVRYSFADIGDIIRGRDMWDLNEGSQKMEVILEKIFRTLHNKLPGMKEKYKNKDVKHLDLRSDWWEANRDQVWEAMKCPKDGMNCDKGETPLDDYIPQRLRWMTELAEWYCKLQKKEYTLLPTDCEACVSNSKGAKCVQHTEKYKKCKTAIDAYKAKIDPWKKQWNNLEKQYSTLYANAQIAAGKGGPRYYIARVQKKDKSVFKFLYDLYIQNGGIVGPPPVPFSETTEILPTNINTPYDNAGAYVHDTGNLSDCKEGKEFCNRAIRFNAIKNTLKEDDDNASDSESETKPSEPLPDVDEVCKIVEGILTVDTLKEACSRKYVNGKEKFPNWRCIPSGNTSETADALGRARLSVTTAAISGLCIPPRRRKLYIHKVDNGITDDASLRKWFIETAAIETFFLWHKFKKENKPQGVGSQLLTTLDGGSVDGDDEDPEKLLQKGEIPDGFLRQMFYTLADYKDILDGKDIVGDTNNSGDNKDTVTLKQKIDNFFEQSGKNQESDRPKKSATENPRKSWWEKNGEHIWNGMICALTHKTEDPKVVDEKVKGALLDTSGTKPQNNLYEYDKVVLKEDESGGEKARTASPTSQGTQLTDFISRPPYFRWLEEWGETFCRERKKRLEKIKEDCYRNDGRGEKQYSGDGEDCTQMLRGDPTIVRHLEGRSCANSCSFYRKWINKKRTEFDEQKKEYGEQQKKYRKKNEGAEKKYHNIYDKQFLGDLEKYESIESFLGNLKSGPCKIENAEDNKPQSYLKFDDKGETFKDADNCKPCSQFKIDCQKGNCDNSKGNNCNGKKVITASNIENEGISIGNVDMVVSDKSGNEFQNDLNECAGADIFQGIKENKWSCRNVCGYVVCKPKNGNGQNDGTYIIQIRALVKRWLETFFEDYNKINSKISHCTKKGDGYKCIKECGKKCNCVGKWIEKKKKEWVEIKKRYLEQHKVTQSQVFEVKSFLQQGMFTYDVDKAIKPCTTLDNFEKSKECAVAANSENGHTNKKDIVQCLLDRLQNKIDKCKAQPRENSDKTSDNPETRCVNPIPVEDNDEPLEEENTVGNEKVGNKAPAFCPAPVEETKKVVEDEKCEPAQTTPEEPKKVTDICGDDGKTVNCPDVDENVEIKVPIVPKPGEPSRNNDGNGTNCAGIRTDKSQIKWKNNEDGEYQHLRDMDKGVYISPRRQKLCVKGLEDAKEEPQLKNKLLNAAANDAYNLAVKYNDYKDKYTVPPCHALKYSFYDYKYMILGEDPLEPDSSGTGKALKKLFTKIGSKGGEPSSMERKEFWDKYKSCVWEAMKCGYTQGRKIVTTAPSIDDCGNTPNEFDNVPQFLMWFTEWSEDFCKQRELKVKELEAGCEKFECNNGDNEEQKKKCANACKEYQTWLQVWKDQYNKQKGKFHKDKKENMYKNTYAGIHAEDLYSAHEYLHDQLQKLCTNGDCSCMENFSVEVEETDLPGKKYLPEALDYPPKEIKKKCDCAIPPEPMSCVERTAQQLRKDAEKNIEIELKGNANRYNNNCNYMTKEEYQDIKGKTCYFKDTIWSKCKLTNDQCESIGKKRFKIGEKWDCDEDKTVVKNKLYIPPRRKDMCLKRLHDIREQHISDSKTLLEKIQEVAQNEGDDIIKNLLPENPCKENIICEAMKYSFADIGDIVRGRSEINPKNNNIEDILRKVFAEIYAKLQGDIKSKYQDNGDKKYTKLREAWWNANRKNVWKAMTCNVPNAALLKKRINKPGHTSKPMDSQNSDTQTEQTKKCGHNTEPPDYDYIPERYRFLQEWSEYYCKSKKIEFQKLQTSCNDCKNGSCQKDDNVEKCQKCVTQCESYNNFVSEWEKQLDEQKELYKELYIRGSTANSSEISTDYVKKFLNKLTLQCDPVSTIDNYLHESTHCTEYLYPKSKSDESNYAFSKYPKEYENACSCKKKTDQNSLHPLEPFIRPLINITNIPGLNKIKKAVPRIPKRIKNIRPDAHTIHELVARTFPYFVPFFQTDDKTPPTHNILNDVLPSAIPVGIALALTSIAFLYLKKKSKSSVDFLRVLNIPKGEYEMPTLKSSNRYIPYASDRYKGKTYIYIEGDSSGDEDKYMFLSDSTDITSSESEYEELDINDIYVPGSPKYKTLIEVVLEPSKRDTRSDDTPSNDIQPTYRFTDEEWSELKHNFISQYLPNTEPNTLYFDKPEEKPFITSIHDRDLYTGEEIKYNINMTNTNNDIPMSDKNGTYTGINLINDALSGNQHIDIYDEVLKRKENELFGTKHPKRTSNNSVAKNTNNDPIMNQLDLFHTWLDRHRDICEQWNNKEDILNKLNEEWNKDNDIGNVPKDNKTLNTNVSIQIDMDHGKPKKEFTNMDTYPENSTMDTILEDLDKYNEPYYDVQDDIYYDVNDHDTSTVDSNAMDVPSKVQIEMDVNNKLVKEKYPIADVWDI